LVFGEVTKLDHNLLEMSLSKVCCNYIIKSRKKHLVLLNKDGLERRAAAIK